MAIVFDGVNQYAYADEAFQANGSTSPATLAFFMKPNGQAATGYPAAVNDNSQWYYHSARFEPTPEIAGRMKTLTSILTAYSAVTDQAWVPVIVTNNGSGTISSYVGSTTAVSATGDVTTLQWDRATVGCALQTGLTPGDFFKGKLTYAMYFEREWTAGEISAYINATSVADINAISTTGRVFRYDLISDLNADGAGVGLTAVNSPTFDADDPLAAVGGVTVTDVDTDEDVYPGQTVTVTGTGFGATQSSGAVTIDGVTQAVTSWADTSIQITVTQGDLKYGAHTLQVTNSLAESGTLGITLSADTANNYLYVDVVDPANSDSTAFSYNTTPAVATGDQLEVQFFAPITSMTVQADTLISSVDSAGTAAARFWDATTSTWGPIETFSVSESGDVIVTPSGRRIGTRSFIKDAIRAAAASAIHGE